MGENSTDDPLWQLSDLEEFDSATPEISQASLPLISTRRLTSQKLLHKHLCPSESEQRCLGDEEGLQEK
jgi:hypothetical protein